MTDTTTARLSPRHECFVLEYHKDGNATQAHLRAGYAPRGAQPSASRLLRDVRIEAAVTAGRQRFDLDKAGQAQQSGIEHRIRDHSKGEQTVTLKLGKVQALAALTKHVGLLVKKPAQGLTAQDRQRYEERCDIYRRTLDHREQEQERLRRELHEARRWLRPSSSAQWRA